MKELNFYKQQINRAIEEGVVEYQKGEKKTSELIKDIFGGETKYIKMLSAISLLSELMPDSIFEKVKKILDRKDFSKLPFDPKKYKFIEKISNGAVSSVHLLEAINDDEPSYVAKFDYINYGSLDKIREIAKQQNKEFKIIKDNYSDLPNLIPDEVTFITTDKKDGSPIIATLQKYLGKDIRDVFTEIEKEELVELLKSNARLRDEFVIFVDKTVELKNNNGEIIDFLGLKNLSIIIIDDEPHLMFIDPHNIYSIDSKDTDRLSKLEKAVSYLEEIKNLVI